MTKTVEELCSEIQKAIGSQKIKYRWWEKLMVWRKRPKTVGDMGDFPSVAYGELTGQMSGYALRQLEEAGRAEQTD